MAEYLLYSDGDNKALRDAIFKATPKAIEQTKSIAPRFKGATDEDTCRNIWNFLKNEIRYVADGEHQKVKLPSALLREKVGDCKSYSLFTASILTNLGIPWHYVLTSYNNDPTPSHIYVVCDNGVIVDAVWTAFNQEKKPSYRYKHKVNDMKISYIAGIPARKRTMAGCGAGCSCNPCRSIGSAVFGRKGLQGTQTMISAPTRVLGTESKFMGIGRTGIDWLKAATGREATAGEQIEYYSKNASLLPARFLVEKFIANNGGGIANFLYNAWLRSEPYYLPNQKKYDAEFAMAVDEYKKQNPTYTFTMNAQESAMLNSKFTPSDSGSLVFNANAPKGQVVRKIEDVLSPVRLAEYKKSIDSFNKLEAFKKGLAESLNKKYPENTRVIKPANDKSKAKYRDIELMWFWKFGGSPDDLNNAVKEGNTKAPRGKDANYLLRKAADGNIKFKDIGLMARAFVSAFAGDKFGLGEGDTFVMTINGIRGGEPASTTAEFTTFMAYAKPIMEMIGGLVVLIKGLGIDFGGDEGGGDSGNGGDNSENGGGSGSGSGDEDDSDSKTNTSTLLLIGAALVGGFLILNQK